MNPRIPTYRRGGPGGQYAYVRLGKKEHALGRYGSTESRQRYDRLILSWLAAGRQDQPDGHHSLEVVRAAVQCYSSTVVMCFHCQTQRGPVPTEVKKTLEDVLAHARVVAVDLYTDTPTESETTRPDDGSATNTAGPCTHCQTAFKVPTERD